MTFAPRVALARELAQSCRPSATIDVSDGLSRDLRQICQSSGVGAVLDAASIPIHDDARQLAARDGRPPLDHALHDGEDHELLFTVPDTATAAEALARRPEIRRIGTVTREPGLWLDHPAGAREPLPAGGWEHAL
jgi:thiamine-monophosphate kinase